MAQIDDFKFERQKDAKICGMSARVIKVTNKKTKDVSYSCNLPLSTNKKTKKEAVKEIEFLMTMVQRIRK